MRKYIFVLIVLLLIYTRFVGLDWALPFPMHPDERNMADAVMRLTCDASIQSIADLKNCYNPHFYAYGQLPLYLAYVFIKFWQVGAALLSKKVILNFPIATLGLRIVSAFLSVLLSYAMWKTYSLLKDKIPESKGVLNISSAWFDFLALLLLVFQPYLLQYAHFGTTETILMLLYISTVYFSLKYIERPSWKWMAANAAVVGIAAATKISGSIYGAVPFLALIYSLFRGGYFKNIKEKVSAFLRYSFTFGTVFCVSYILSSPHNILSWKDFISSMNYEIPVGNGSLLVFYTRQFIDTIPYIFQFTHIFPYALGLPVLILSILGFFVLPWRNPFVNVLRFSWLIYFVVTGSLFIKWSRFMAPIMPLMTLFAIFALLYICRNVNFEKKLARLCLFIVAVVLLTPGYAYLTIYTQPDVRFVASKIIADTIPAGSSIFEEGGNVINIPVPPPDTSFMIPFYMFKAVDVYDVTTDNDMLKIQSILDQANVVIIPSRRIFASRTCLRPTDIEFDVSENLLKKDCEKLAQMYPYHQSYYSQIFAKESQFIQTARISSYPRIEFFGKILLEFPDEFAEETWTVFDHPVIRIYERVNPLN